MSETKKRPSKAKAAAELELAPAPVPETPFGEKWIRTDDLPRGPAAQMRTKPDPNLVAEYAQAMIEGAKFPAVIIFQDEAGDRHLADGYHRVDAAALAALQETNRKAEVLADVRPGTFDDAVRYAMRANL